MKWKCWKQLVFWTKMMLWLFWKTNIMMVINIKFIYIIFCIYCMSDYYVSNLVFLLFIILSCHCMSYLPTHSSTQQLQLSAVSLQHPVTCFSQNAIRHSGTCARHFSFNQVLPYETYPVHPIYHMPSSLGFRARIFSSPRPSRICGIEAMRKYWAFP